MGDFEDMLLKSKQTNKNVNTNASNNMTISAGGPPLLQVFIVSYICHWAHFTTVAILKIMAKARLRCVQRRAQLLFLWGLDSLWGKKGEAQTTDSGKVMERLRLASNREIHHMRSVPSAQITGGQPHAASPGKQASRQLLCKASAGSSGSWRSAHSQFYFSLNSRR